jgi:DDE superfamily endonuclease
MAYEVYHDSVDTDRFNAFIEDSGLPLMTAYLGPCSVLVMDNHSTHHLEYIQELCDARGVILLYLPPYSPDYNPIEQSFAALKAWMRANRVLARIYGDDVEGFICLAVESVFKGKNACGHFRAAGIGIPQGYDVDSDLKDTS